MHTLYLTDPTYSLSRVGKSLRLEQDGQPVARVFIESVRQVFLFGQTQIDSATLTALARRGIPIVWLTEHGHFVARLEGPPTGAPSLRRAQYLCAEDSKWALENARSVLRCKLLGARALLLRHLRNHKTPDLKEAATELMRLRRLLLTAPLLSKLRGLEGHAGAVYFRAFNGMLRQDLSFVRRTRRPAGDPVNALLSLAYGLVRIELESHLTGMGLDARVGFLHVQRGQRPALALDLLEEFRAEVCDRLVLRCFNLGLLQERHFTVDEEGACRLSQPGRQVFMREYEIFMEKPWRDLDGRRLNYRRLFHVQMREMTDAIRQNRVYVPHLPRI